MFRFLIYSFLLLNYFSNQNLLSTPLADDLVHKKLESVDDAKLKSANELLDRFLEKQNRFTGSFLKPTDPTHFSASMSTPVQTIYRQAWLAAYERNFATAQNLYDRLLSMGLSNDLQRELLLEVAAMYELKKDNIRKAAVYEKFIEEFPRDPVLPVIYIELGRMYRNLGDNKMAINKFYSVLNSSLSVPDDLLPMYKAKTLEAQLEIAETHFRMQNFHEAEKFLERLKLLNLSPSQKALVDFKLAYIAYNQKDFPKAATLFSEFIKYNPSSPLVPESRYLLSMIYSNLNRRRDAMDQVFLILQDSLQYQNDANAHIWFKWRKIAGNQLANELYLSGDYLNSLRIYQKMAEVNKHPAWQWPIIYQIGLCFERLRMPEKAKKAYDLIVTENQWKGMNYVVTDEMKMIQDSAKWQLDHLKWQTNTQDQIDNLIVTPLN